MELFSEFHLFLMVCDEGISAQDSSFKYLNVRCCFPDAFDSQLPEGFIGWKLHDAELRNLAGLIAEDFRVDIMVHRIFRYDEIADIDIVVQRTCDTGIEDMRDMEYRDQQLRTYAGIDFADTRAYQHDFLGSDGSFDEGHPGDGFLLGDVHLFLQRSDFYFHRSDDSDLHWLPHFG